VKDFRKCEFIPGSRAKEAVCSSRAHDCEGGPRAASEKGGLSMGRVHSVQMYEGESYAGDKQTLTGKGGGA